MSDPIMRRRKIVRKNSWIWLLRETTHAATAVKHACALVYTRVHTFNVQEFDATVLTVLEGYTDLFEASALGLVP